MQGIYKITNIINNKSYIGLSNNIEKRWNVHKSRAFIKKDKEYEKTLYRAIRKYGINNFHFEVLEEVKERDKLEEREKYWIQFYNTFEQGYNETSGGPVGSLCVGEVHPNAILTEEEVIDIRTRYRNHERCKKVYDLYKDRIGWSGFHKVWKGENWTHLMMEVYTKENIYFHTHNTGQKGSENGRAKLTEKNVYDIRYRKKNGEEPKIVYLDYEHLLTFPSFMNVWYGCNWKHIVV